MSGGAHPSMSVNVHIRFGIAPDNGHCGHWRTFKDIDGHVFSTTFHFTFMSMSVDFRQCSSMSVNFHVRFDSTPDNGHCGRAPMSDDEIVSSWRARKIDSDKSVWAGKRSGYYNFRYPTLDWLDKCINIQSQ